MKLYKEKGKYWITNEKRLCKRGCTLEELTLTDLKKILQLVLEEIRFEEVRKHERLIVGDVNWKRE